MSHVPRFVTVFAVALLAASSGARGVHQGGRIKVDIGGHQGDVVQLSVAATGAPIASDLVAGEPLRDSLVTPDDSVVAVRLGRGDDGDGLCAYAVTWTIDPPSGAEVGKVTQVLTYHPRDGHLGVSLERSPHGVIMQVQTGRHPPLWHKTFFYESAHGRWYEWPKTRRPGYPMDGQTPAPVSTVDTGQPYSAYLRPPTPAGGR